MFIAVNSTLIIFRKSFSIRFYVSILHRIAVLICNSVLVVCQSSESADVVQTVSKSKLSTLVASKKSRRRRALILKSTLRKIVNAKVGC